MAEENKEKIDQTKERFGFQWNLINDKFKDRLYADFSKEFDELSPFIKKEDFSKKVVLDAGCGTGRVTDLVAKQDASLAIGVDISPSVHAARKNNADNANAFIVQSDLNRLPFNAKFDIITAFGVLHHTPDPRMGFLNLARYLAPGGKIEILIYAKEDSRRTMELVNILRKLTYKQGATVRYYIALMVNILLSVFVWICYWGTKIFGLSGAKNKIEYFLYLYRNGFTYRQAVILDFLSTPIIYFFTKDDIEKWFSESGLVNFRIKKRNNNTWCAYGENG